MTDTSKKKIILSSIVNPDNHVTIILQVASNHNIDHNELNQLFKQLTSSAQMNQYVVYIKPAKPKAPKHAMKNKFTSGNTV
jgi:helix-turn-helix protein